MPVAVWYADEQSRWVNYVRGDTYTYPKNQLVIWARDGDVVDTIPLYRLSRVEGKKQTPIVVRNEDGHLLVELRPRLVGDPSIFDDDEYGPDGMGLVYGDWSPSR